MVNRLSRCAFEGVAALGHAPERNDALDGRNVNNMARAGRVP